MNDSSRSAASPRSGLARPRRLGLWIFLLGIAAVGVFWLIQRASPTSVQTVALEGRDIRQTLVVAGQVRAPSRAGLGAAIAGVVSYVGVSEGARVRAGEVLVRLDDREFRAAVAQAEAALAETRAAVGAELARAESDHEQASRDLERIRALFAEGAFTRQQVELAEQRAEDARTRLDVAQASMGPDGTNVSIARAEAALEAARARLELTQVTAPADGTVLSRTVEPGDAVQPGRVLLEVSSDGLLELVAFPSEENLSRLTAGAEARVSADAYPSEQFAARVTLISPVVDADQGTIEVRLAPDDPPTYLRPDMTLSVNIEVGRKEGAAVLPEDAVRGLGTSEPWVGVVSDGQMVERHVTVGFRGEGYVEILSGLEEGEPVVLGELSLEPGTRVRARP